MCLNETGFTSTPLVLTSTIKGVHTFSSDYGLLIRPQGNTVIGAAAGMGKTAAVPVISSPSSVITAIGVEVGVIR